VPDHIQSVERAATILRFLSAQPGMVGVSEIARNVGLGKSTVHRLLATLCQTGFVRADVQRGQYAIGFGLLRLTADWLNGIEIRTAALPELRKLRRQTGETVSLNMRDADMLVPIERLDTQQAIRYVVELGKPQSLHLGAGGKAILAFMPETEIDDLLASVDLGPDRTKTLRDALAQIRKDGSAVTRGEVVPGACAISAPVFNRDGTVVGSLSVLCLESTLDENTAMTFGRALRESAAEVSTVLGWSGSGAVHATARNQVTNP
jgi:DNA-binding IclR family transcriptional regulator